jgi:integrase
MDLVYLSGQRPADVLKMRLADIRDGFLWLTQGKTRTKLRMAIAGELAALFDRMQGRAYKVTSLTLIRNETGQPLSYHALWNRFEEARKRAANSLDACRRGGAAAAIRGFQFRDLRAKAGTDKADSTGLRGAQQQLGHRSVKTTGVLCMSGRAIRSHRQSNPPNCGTRPVLRK